MRIGLIDVDGGGKFPNIALMKISAAHKMRGDIVEWYMPFSERYQIVYCSKVFSFTPDYNLAINANNVVCGGTGYQIKLQDGKEVFNRHPQVTGNRLFVSRLDKETEHIYPDYSIYPKLTKDTAYGFLTRGCPRGCQFCHVAAKVGKCSQKVADLSEFWRDQKNIVLCDPNILACKEWKPLLQQLIDSKAYIDFNQGLDARLMTPEKAEILGDVKLKEIHFAWDRLQDADSILRGLEIYGKYAKNKPHGHKAIVFILVNFDTNIFDDLERIYKLRDMGYWAYVMIYDKEHAHPEYKHLARWCNNRRIFATCPRYEDYLI